jgi:hypothetical protein
MEGFIKKGEYGVYNTESILEFICEPKKRLNDSIIDSILDSFFCIGSNEKVLVVRSLNIDSILNYGDLSLNDGLLKLGISKAIFDDIQSENGKICGIMCVIFSGNGTYGISCGHWSLLYYSKKLERSYHYDSFYGLNDEKCSSVGKLMKRYRLFTEKTKCFCPDFTPIQKSDWDCGYYMLSFIHIILKKGELEFSPISQYDIEDIYWKRFYDRDCFSLESEFRKTIIEHFGKCLNIGNK